MTGGTIERDELITILPHKGKMFLLSRITAYDTIGRSLSSEYDITRDCLFYDSELGGVPSWVSFEFMAQSVSSLSGLTHIERGEPPQVGCILSVSDMEMQRPLLKAGTTVCIHVQEECAVEDVFTFDCMVSLNELAVGSARLTLMDMKDLSAFERGHRQYGN